MLEDEVTYADAYPRRIPPESGSARRSNVPFKDLRCLASAAVYPRALQPRREVPPDELLQPQDVFLVTFDKLLAELRIDRRRLGEDPALHYSPHLEGERQDAGRGRKNFPEDAERLVRCPHRGAGGSARGYAGRVVPQGSLRSEGVVNLDEAVDTLDHASGTFPHILVEPHPEPIPPEHLVITFQLLIVEPPAAVVKYIVPAVTHAEWLFAERLREVGERLYPNTDSV